MSDYDVIEELNERNLSYEFNDLLIVKGNDGELYYIQDSGCSCPGRLENAVFPTDFNILNEKTFDNFLHEVTNFPADMTEK